MAGFWIQQVLVRPQGLQEVRCVAAKLLRLVAVARDRFSRFWRSLEQARRLGGAQESPGKAPGVPGTPQEQLRNEKREI